MPPKKKTQTVVIDKEKITFKPGALRSMLKLPTDYKFSKSSLERLKKIETGKKFKFLDNDFKMSPLMKRRINFALVLMK